MALDQEIFIVDFSDVPDADRPMQATDKVLVRLLDGSGVVMTPDQLAAVFGVPGDLYGFTAPTDQPGKEKQKYFHTREAEQLVDLYQFTNGSWGTPRIKGIVLDARNNALPTPPAPTFDLFQNTQAGGSTRLKPALGVPMSDYMVRIGLDGDYAPAPLDGIVIVGDITGRVYAYSIATPKRNRSETGASPEFTTYVPSTTPTTPVLIKADPPGIEADDVANTLVFTSAVYGSGEIVYRTNGGAFQPYTGPIGVGNVFRPKGYYQAKVKAAAGRSESIVVDSPLFTLTPVTGNTTPTAPEYVIDDTANTLVFSSPLGDSEILVSVAGGAYQPYAGIIQVGDVFRPVGYWKAKIKAATGRNESGVTNSPLFTATTTQPAPTYSASYTTTPADYTTKCGAGTGDAQSATVTGYSAQPDADTAAKMAAIAKIVCNVVPGVPTFTQTLYPEGIFNVDTVNWDSAPGIWFKYNNPIQANATIPGASAMAVFYPDLNTQIGLFNFDPADAGKPCGVFLNNTLFYKDATTNSALTFKDGAVLLGS